MIQVPLKTSKYRFRFRFCLEEGANNGSGWFLVKFNSQKKSCATQEWAKSMKRMFWGVGEVGVGLRMRMNKGRGSAQCGSAPRGTMKLELDSM